MYPASSSPAVAYAANVTFPKPYHRKPKIGRELIKEPGCITAPSAASMVNAMTLSAVAAMMFGTWVIRPTSNASVVKIANQAHATTLTESPGELLYCQGRAPVSIIAAGVIPNGV